MGVLGCGRLYDFTGRKEGFGTDIVMKIKEDSERKLREFLDAFRLRSLIKKYSDFIRYPIKLDGETVNGIVPIWQRTRSG